MEKARGTRNRSPRDAASKATVAGMGGAASSPRDRTACGAMYERLALCYLAERGLRRLGQNVRAAGVEIDLIMRDPAGVVVFVEVRARRSARFGGAAASVCARKRARLRRGAAVWLMRWRGPVPPCRFDVLAFEQGRVVWLRDAFGVAD